MRTVFLVAVLGAIQAGLFFMAGYYMGLARIEEETDEQA